MINKLQISSTIFRKLTQKMALVAGLILLSTFGFNTYAQSDDFEAATLDTNKWKVRNNSHQGYIITGPSPSGSRHLRVNGSSNAGHTNHMYQQFAPITPKEVSWYVKMDTIGAGASGYIVIGDSTLVNNSSSSLVFAYINIGGTPLTSTFTIANVSANYNQPYIVGTWLKVELKNINFTTRRFELWINDTLRNDTFSFRSPTLRNVSYVRTYTLTNSLVYKIDKFVIKSVPGLSTTSPASITSNSAILGGNVLDSGETATSERGIVYGTAPNPTIANTKVQIGNGLGAFSQNITGLTSNTKYYVRAYAINGAGIGYGPMDSFTTTISVDPTITIEGTLGAFKSCIGLGSALDSFMVSGSNLTANIIINAPTGFEISNLLTLGFTSSLNLTQNAGSVPSTKIYVRIKSSATGSPLGAITLTSNGAANKALVVGGIVYPKPTITLSSTSNVLSTDTSFNLNYTGTLGSPNQYSIVTGTPNAMPSFAAVNNATLGSSPIRVSIPASAANSYNFNLTVKNSNTGCISSVVPFALTVGNPEPTISVSDTLGAFAACSGSTSAVDSITVSGSYLTANITINAPTGFEISTTSASGYGNSLTLTQIAGSVAATKIYVRLSSSATGSPSGNIILYSSGDNSVNVAVSGAVNPNPTITLGTIASVAPNATSFNLIYTTTTGNPNQYSIATGTPTAMPSFAAVNNATLGSNPISVAIPVSSANMYNFILTVRNTSTGCSSVNIPFTVTVQNPGISNNYISGDQLVCSGAMPAYITGSIANGGTPPLQYLWISSTTDSVNGFAAATGNNNQSNYWPSAILQKTWFRRIAFDANYRDTSNATLIDVKANPSKPVISIQAANPICQGAQFLNFGAATAAPSGVTYQWSATNANLYAQGNTKQFALISFPNAGTSIVNLTAIQNGCSSDTQVTLTVSSENAPQATVRYFNKNFICETNVVSKYQWGYDMQPSLEGTIINGEINQNYFNATPDFSTKHYWVISSTGACYQKTYYNQASSVLEAKVSMDGISIYPNPVSDKLTIQLKESKGIMQIQVIDLHGKLVQEIFSDQNETELDMDVLTEGIYLVRCLVDNEVIANSKVVKK